MPSTTKPRPSLPFPETGTARDLASLLGVEEQRLIWHLERARRLGRRDLFFGAWQDKDGEWLVPDRVARRICAGWPLQHYTVSQVAALTGCSRRQIRHRLVTVPAGASIEAVPAHCIAARLFFGTSIRVPESELRRLADGLVEQAPAGLEHSKEEDELDDEPDDDEPGPGMHSLAAAPPQIAGRPGRRTRAGSRSRSRDVVADDNQATGANPLDTNGQDPCGAQEVIIESRETGWSEGGRGGSGSGGPPPPTVT